MGNAINTETTPVLSDDGAASVTSFFLESRPGASGVCGSETLTHRVHDAGEVKRSRTGAVCRPWMGAHDAEV